MRSDVFPSKQREEEIDAQLELHFYTEAQPGRASRQKCICALAVVSQEFKGYFTTFKSCETTTSRNTKMELLFNFDVKRN
jgi:hypothetical protein